MKDIHDQYAALSRDYSSLLDDYQDIREDAKLLDAIEYLGIQLLPQCGYYLDENDEMVPLPWRAIAKGTMGPPSSTVREAIQSLVQELKEE